MKILQLVQQPQRRGAEIFARDLSEQLNRDGHEVSTVYLYASMKHSSIPVGKENQMIGASNSHFSERLGFNPSVLLRLSRIVNNFKPDVVQSNGARTVKYGAFLRSLEPKASWVLIYRSIGDPQVWLKGWMKKWFYRRFVIPRFDAIVAVSSLTLEGLKLCYKKIPPAVIIPRAINGAAFVSSRARSEVRAELRTPDSALVMTFVGSLSREKQIHRNLQSLQQLKDSIPNLYLWIVGDGPERKKLEESVFAMNLEHRVRFAGSIEDVASILNATEILVLLSDTEGVPGVVLEAAVLEIPSVASRVGGVPECMIDGKTGLLVDPTKPDEIAKSISMLLRDNDLRIRMGQDAKRYVVERFSIEKIAKEYAAFYARILDAREPVKRCRESLIDRV